MEDPGVLMGEFRHTVDDKGRLFLPARLREELGDRPVLTRGLDGCLFVYSPAAWEALQEKLKSLPLTRAEARAVVRFFFSGAAECEVDRQGRVLIPPNLRAHAGLEKDAVIVGVGTRAEIWAAPAWEAYQAREGSGVEAFAEKLADLGVLD